MAQTAYTGIQGSGKSYEVVSSVIVPQFAKGRRIVTNVAGLNVDLIKKFCVDRLGASPDKLGEIVSVGNDVPGEPGFFPQEEGDSPFFRALEKVTDSEMRSELLAKHQAWLDSSIVKPGDLVILDECWRWYTSDGKLPEGHLKFFRMHRHFLHPVTGQCCDIILIVQDIGDLRRNICATIEKSFLMQKHVDLGLPDRYVVTVYSGNKQMKRSYIEEFQRKYNPDYFPLYSSHSQKKEGGAAAKEERADNRGSVLNRKIIKYGIPFAVLWICAAAWFLWRFFHPEEVKKADVPVKVSEPVKPLQSAVESQKKQTGISDDWRLVGVVDSADPLFVLRSNDGRLRFLSSVPAVKYSRGEIELMLPDGNFVTYWSGGEGVANGRH